jgi:hypothetical protein
MFCCRRADLFRRRLGDRHHPAEREHLRHLALAVLDRGVARFRLVVVVDHLLLCREQRAARRLGDAEHVARSAAGMLEKADEVFGEIRVDGHFHGRLFLYGVR